MKEKLKKILERKEFDYFLIFFFSSLICLPLLSKTIDLYQDDGIQHICRLMGTLQSLSENMTFPVIMSNFCNGFGYSWNLFYSITTAYVPLMFKLFLGVNFVDCIKLFVYMVTILSGFSMYAFTKRITKDRKIATLSAIFYILLPYRLTDMYMRIAIAELASFIFLPMVFHGIFVILEENQEKDKKSKFSFILIVGTVGLVLTHTVVTLYTAIFAFFYLVLQYKKINRKVLIQLFASLILILLLTAFFWVPLLEHKLGAEYEVFQPRKNVTCGNIRIL